MSIVLVTGGSGFLGMHSIIQLLQRGHDVRTTVRSAAREPQVRATLATAGVRLAFFVADLLSDDGWPAATAESSTSCTWRRRSRPARPIMRTT